MLTFTTASLTAHCFLHSGGFYYGVQKTQLKSPADIIMNSMHQSPSREAKSRPAGQYNPRRLLNLKVH
jgi:hypothetical protein